MKRSHHEWGLFIGSLLRTRTWDTPRVFWVRHACGMSQGNLHLQTCLHGRSCGVAGRDRVPVGPPQMKLVGNYELESFYDSFLFIIKKCKTNKKLMS